MKKFFLLLLLLLTGCNTPSLPAPAATLPPPTQIQPTETSAPTLIPTETPLPPSPTPTPIPCDPLTADYCIVNWNFLFQRPILPPGNQLVDLTYLYATTQNRQRDAHHGVEFQNAFGTPVHAAADGEVVFADSDKATKFSPWTNFYGNMVVIRHTDGFYTLYAHLSVIRVEVGAQVRAGDEIGQVGATGGATGSHLHFEVRVGSDFTDYFSTQNPELWLIPLEGTGAISITLMMDTERNYERPIVVTRVVDGSVVFTYYITSYTKGFEYNSEDAVLGSLPAGEYKIQLNDSSGLRERIVRVETGRLTQVVFK